MAIFSKYKKLYYIVNSKIPSSSANSIHVMKMNEAFVSFFENVTLIIPCFSDEKNAEIFQYYGIKSFFSLIKIKVVLPLKKELIFLFKAIKKIASEKESLVYVRELNAVFFLLLFKRDFIIEFHGLPQSFLNKLALKLIDKNPYLKLKVFITESLKKKYFKLGIEDKNNIVLPDAVDLDQIKPSSNGNAFAPIGYVGHLYKGRGIDIIIEIASKLPKYEFVIVGGNDEDIVYWKNYTRDKNVLNVKFKGYLPYAIIGEVLKTFSVLLMPYQNKVVIAGDENSNTSDIMSPMKMFEYMASGVPIVSSDLPVLREILADGFNALLVEPDNVDAWVNAIERIMSDKKTAATIAFNALEDVKNKYTWKRRSEFIIYGDRHGDSAINYSHTDVL